MKRILRAVVFAAVVLLSLLAQSARADYICLPKMATTQIVAGVATPPLQLGSTTVQVETPAAEAEAWWCLEGALTPSGKRSYAPHIRWNLKKNAGHPDLAGVFRRVMVAPDLLAAVNGEMHAASIAVIAGTQDAYERDLVIYTACQALAKPPYLVPIDPLPANWCGSAPVPPGASTEIWRTPASGSLTLFNYSAGKLTGVISGRKAVPNALCSCTVAKAVVGAKTYCAQAVGPANEATECLKQ